MTANELNDLREKVLEGKEYTKEELATAVNVLLGERVAASQATAKASKRRPAKSVDLTDLLPS